MPAVLIGTGIIRSTKKPVEFKIFPNTPPKAVKTFARNVLIESLVPCGPGSGKKVYELQDIMLNPGARWYESGRSLPSMVYANETAWEFTKRMFYYILKGFSQPLVSLGRFAERCIESTANAHMDSGMWPRA
jgi:hypothetical protein